MGVGLMVSTFVFQKEVPLPHGLAEHYEATSDAASDTVPDTLTLISWNVMQAAAGSTASGASEQGMPGRPAKADYQLWWEGISKFVDSAYHDHAILMLQNVSAGSSISHSENQMDAIARMADNEDHWNSTVMHENRWCPLPLFTQGKHIATGMGALMPGEVASGAEMGGGRRLQGGPGWPWYLWRARPCYQSLHLDRGFDLEYLNVDLLPENDSAAIMQMLAHLQVIATREYEAGDHVILGGDWGMMPPFFRQEMFSMGGSAPEGIVQMPADWLSPDWTIAYDPMDPTTRSLNGPMNNHTPRTTTDFFICSPNVRVVEVKTVDLGFRYSNHQPVQMKVILQ